MKPESNARQEVSARGKRRRLPVAWILVAPFLFFYVAFLIYPSIQVAYLSFTNSDITGTGTFVGLQNYAELIHDADFWASLWHTLYFIILTVVPNTAVGFLLALLVIRLKRLRLPILSAFFLQFVLPVSVVTTGALWLMDTNFGIINYLVGSSISWFQDPNWAMPAVAVVTIWWTVGFNMLLFIAGLQKQNERKAVFFSAVRLHRLDCDHGPGMALSTLLDRRNVSNCGNGDYCASTHIHTDSTGSRGFHLRHSE